MRTLALVFVVGLVIGQSYFGQVVYLLALGALVTIFLVGERVYLPASKSYLVGGALLLTSGLVATVVTRSIGSATYLVTMTASYFAYPLFRGLRLTRAQYGWFAVAIALFSVPIYVAAPKAGFHTILGNPNNYASSLLCFSYFLLLLTDGQKLKQLAIYAVYFALIYLTSSRTVLAAMLGFGLLYVSQRYVLKTVFRRRTALLVLGFWALYVTILTDDRFQILAAVQESNVGGKGYNGLSYRDVLLYISIDIVRDNPLGVGLGNAGVAIKEVLGRSLSPHNAFLKMAVEGGVGMLAGYLVLLFGAILRNRSPLASSFIVALIVRCTFESATPFTGSIVSAMLVLPFFFNESSLEPVGGRRPASPATPAPDRAALA